MILTICERLAGADNIKIKFDTLEETLKALKTLNLSNYRDDK
jgi:hypothetical protein